MVFDFAKAKWYGSWLGVLGNLQLALRKDLDADGHILTNPFEMPENNTRDRF
jgi:hypothetical protein